MRVSQVNDKPLPIETPVTFITCSKKTEFSMKNRSFKFLHWQVQFQSKHRVVLTAIANDTAASSVFPRWPQKTVLMKLIMKIINEEMI